MEKCSDRGKREVLSFSYRIKVEVYLRNQSNLLWQNVRPEAILIIQILKYDPSLNYV